MKIRKGTILEHLYCLFFGHWHGDLYTYIDIEKYGFEYPVVIPGCLRCRRELI